jgi:hypothetical protein
LYGFEDRLSQKVQMSHYLRTHQPWDQGHLDPSKLHTVITRHAFALLTRNTAPKI